MKWLKCNDRVQNSLFIACQVHVVELAPSVKLQKLNKRRECLQDDHYPMKAYCVYCGDEHMEGDTICHGRFYHNRIGFSNKNSES